MKANEPCVHLVDDDAELRALLRAWLEEGGCRVEEFEHAEGCVAALRSGAEASLVLLDLGLPGLGGEQVLPALRERHRDLPIVVLTAKRDVRTVALCVRDGAYDFIRKPVDRERLLTTVRNAVAYRALERRLARLGHAAHERLPGIVAVAPCMDRLARDVERAAASSVNVVIHGESGTGKELVAAAVHALGDRRSGPFVAVNCAAIPESLQDSELFGHERGSFTGATARHVGSFERAAGGTLFLDEIAELGPGAQSRLLRVLEERKIWRVGGKEEVAVDFRLVAASHRRLQSEVEQGRFREDLYYRIVVLELEVPPLREREGDVDLLCDHFVAEFAPPGTAITIAPEARPLLRRYPWPGNVRELRNVVQRAVLGAEGGVLGPADLPRSLIESALLQPENTAPEDPPAPAVPEGALVLQPGVTLAEAERQLIVRALARAKGNMRRAAAELGIARATLYRKLQSEAE